MHHLITLIARGCSVLALALLMAVPAAAETRSLDRIVAVVNDGVILASELDDEIALVRERLTQEGRDVPPQQVLRERLLENLIVERLQIQVARQYGVSIDDESVNQALSNMARQYDTDLTGLREMFTREGIDFARVREDVRNQLIVSQLRQRAVASQINVPESEIEEELRRLDQAEDRRSEYRLRHILIGLPSDAGDDAIAAARERAAELVAELRGGGDFSATAARISDGPRALDGGDLGWRAAGEWPSLFVEAIRGLDRGDITDPVQSPNGFHILKVEDRRGGSTQSVTEIRARHILIAAGDDADEDEAARRELAELRRRLDGGASFEELARARSDDTRSARQGGDLGWFGPGDMVPAFQAVVADLRPGQLSEPFRTPFGWHVVEVLDERERTDARGYRRAQVQQALYRQYLEEETQRWLSELRDDAYVELRLDH